MDIQLIDSFQWGAMIPELVILAAALFLLAIDLIMPKRILRRKVGLVIGLAAIVAAIAVLLSFSNLETISILNDTFYLDGFAKAFKLILLIASGLYLILASSYRAGEVSEAYRAEFNYLFLTALLGAMLITSSADLMTLFVGLELFSLSLVVLIAFRKQSPHSSEAALKYFVNSGIASAIALFGFSYLYGLSGSTNLLEIATAFREMAHTDGQLLATIAFFLILIGFAFKMIAVPFHMWAPDVYEGAATPVTGLLAVVSKSVGFIALTRVVYSVFFESRMIGQTTENLFSHVQVYLLVLAGLSILVGNIVALKQKRLKRMLAYSSIGHAGYLLATFSAPGLFTTETLWFYLLAYTLMMFGVLAVVQWVSSEEGMTEDLKGLYTRSPIVAIGFAVLVLSLAGIPGTAGFIAKASVLMNLMTQGKTLMVLAGIVLGGTMLSYLYYFQLLAQVFSRKAVQIEQVPSRLSTGVAVVLIICVTGTLLLGVLPNLGFDLVRLIL